MFVNFRAPDFQSKSRNLPLVGFVAYFFMVSIGHRKFPGFLECKYSKQKEDPSLRRFGAGKDRTSDRHCVPSTLLLALQRGSTISLRKLTRIRGLFVEDDLFCFLFAILQRKLGRSAVTIPQKCRKDLSRS